MKIVHLKKKMRKNDLVASPTLRREDFRRKIREYQGKNHRKKKISTKNPKKFRVNAGIIGDYYFKK
jgi:hypothetical protein